MPNEDNFWVRFYHLVDNFVAPIYLTIEVTVRIDQAARHIGDPVAHTDRPPECENCLASFRQEERGRNIARQSISRGAKGLERGPAETPSQFQRFLIVIGSPCQSCKLCVI